MNKDDIKLIFISVMSVAFGTFIGVSFSLILLAETLAERIII